MKQQEDKRIVRSKRLIQEALAELLEEKSFDSITVTDIVRRADINRGTFYAYYKDVKNLRDQLEAELMGKLQKIIGENQKYLDNGNFRPLVSQILNYAEENRSLIQMLSKASGIQQLQAMLLRLIQTYHTNNVRWPHPQWERYIQQYVACGLMGTIELWLNSPEPMSTEYLIDLMAALLLSLNTIK